MLTNDQGEIMFQRFGISNIIIQLEQFNIDPIWILDLLLTDD